MQKGGRGVGQDACFAGKGGWGSVLAFFWVNSMLKPRKNVGEG